MPEIFVRLGKRTRASGVEKEKDLGSGPSHLALGFRDSSFERCRVACGVWEGQRGERGRGRCL